MRHVCKQKRRYLQREDKPVVMGFIAFQQFYATQMRQKNVAFAKFADSQFYEAFVRFGRYLIDLDAVNKLGFIDFLLQVEVPLHRWTEAAIYAMYIRELNKTETPLDALERNFLLMQQWANATGESWRDFFRRVETPLATLWISTGRISPWVLCLASSAQQLLKRFTPEQAAMVEKAVDAQFWQLKIQHHQQDVEMIRQTLREHEV
jgi:hypothetical protein